MTYCRSSKAVMETVVELGEAKRSYISGVTNAHLGTESWGLSY